MSDEKRLVPRIRFPEFTDDWEQRKLIEYLEVSRAKNKELVFGKEDVLSVSGDYGVVNQIEFQGRSFAGASVAPYGIVETGDVIYTKSPLKSNPYGIIKTNKGKTGIVSTLYAVYKPLENVHSEFVQIYFEQDARMNNYMHPLVNKGAKNDMKVSDENALMGDVIFPKKEEQIRISEFFARLGHLITLHQRKCDTYKKMKKGMVQKLFNQEVRFKKKDGSDYADWVRTPMRDCVTSVSVKKKDTFAEVYSVSNVSGFIPQTEQFGGRDNIASADTKNYKLVSKGQFAYNPSRINVGSLARLDCTDLVAVSPLYVVFEVMANLDSDYLLNWFDTHEFKRGMRENIEGGVRNSLTFDGLANITITYPSDIEEQTKIANCLAEFDNLIDASERRLEAYKLLKKAMLQKMFV